MIARDINDLDSDVNKKAKVEKINSRIAFALDELKIFPEIEKAMSKNLYSKTFLISDDNTLYSIVIPYIKKINSI